MGPNYSPKSYLGWIAPSGYLGVLFHSGYLWHDVCSVRESLESQKYKNSLRETRGVNPPATSLFVLEQGREKKGNFWSYKPVPKWTWIYINMSSWQAVTEGHWSWLRLWCIMEPKLMIQAQVPSLILFSFLRFPSLKFHVQSPKDLRVSWPLVIYTI